MDRLSGENEQTVNFLQFINVLDFLLTNNNFCCVTGYFMRMWF